MKNNKNQRKLYDYTIYAENPFLKELKIHRGYRAASVSRTSQIVDEDGVLTGHEARMVIREPVDKTNFVKLYPENLPFTLSPFSLKLFLFLLTKCEYNTTRVYFNPMEWQDEDKKTEGLFHSTRTIYACVKELLHMRLIARGGAHYYFINPTVGFKGNRLELLK